MQTRFGRTVSHEEIGNISMDKDKDHYDAWDEFRENEREYRVNQAVTKALTEKENNSGFFEFLADFLVGAFLLVLYLVILVILVSLAAIVWIIVRTIFLTIAG